MVIIMSLKSTENNNQYENQSDTFGNDFFHSQSLNLIRS